MEITTYSDDNAYTIFESMNDRGLNLTSTEMLKGYTLSRLKEPKDRDRQRRNSRTRGISAAVSSATAQIGSASPAYIKHGIVIEP